MCQGVAIFVLFDISTNIWHAHASEENFYFKIKIYTLKRILPKTKKVHMIDFSIHSQRDPGVL